MKSQEMQYAYSMPTTEVAKEIRQALKNAFPDVKFSVRKHGYNSIFVRYNDADLKCCDVEAIARKFEGSSFDGMTDSMNVKPDVELNGRMVRFMNDFVFVTNDAPFVGFDSSTAMGY